MAKKLRLGFQSTKDGGIDDLKRRLLFVMGALIVFRIGSFIPIPGIDGTVLIKLLEQQRGTIIEMFNMFSGGALSRASLFTLGIMPYISASIIVQLLTVIHPTLSEIKKDGEFGRRKISQYTRYGALVLAICQAIGIANGLPRMPGMQELIINPGFAFYLTAVASLVCGTIFLMWLGEQITERSISNGISIIIFAGIVSGLPPAIGHTIEQSRQSEIPSLLMLLLVTVLGLVMTFFVVLVERGQRRISVNYAKRHQGRRVYAAHGTHLPLKLNMAGVTPTIFASSIILFPATIASCFGGGTGWGWLSAIALYLQPNKPLYVVSYASAIIFFCFFYTALVFNPREIADNLKKSGAFVSGMRPGEQTARYIEKIMNRLTLVGSLYMTLICLIPEFMREAMKVPFYLGGTSLLIVVVVIMEFLAQVQTMMMSSRYESTLKKANMKN
ncbi:Preprotein translocase subunit secY [Candidatus Moranella endobia PCVAL]|uniref:Protein translocase subunit SecY n=1 Tax=Moranella endobia (strain PCIT) TaxID=903503 RepID=F7XY59_MOREP|nr:preprotein translocase subunit SecY [Candidatus Moranella endobia]AEI75035.1 preprotein translocase SecY subunit [Candidatus Moranella endobia PCIT]AGJ61283.1 Preprotein translocase subunit secY [Candidatus Moranella endobia PCVAL]